MANLTQTLASLDELKASIEQSSCISKEPFIRLDPTPDPAPELKYRIPQATCYPVTGSVILDIPLEKFKNEHKVAPVNNFYDVMPARDLDGIRVALDTKMDAIPRQHLLRDAGVLRFSTVELNREGVNLTAIEGDTHDTATRPFTVKAQPSGDMIAPFIYPVPEKDFIANRIKQGYLPLPVVRFSGMRDIEYIPKPPAPKPEISIVLHYKMCSFAGDYGAGQTLKTFSLLPGEKTEISIRHFLRKESTRKDSQHVLDSFSTSSADDLQHTLENETSMTYGEADTESKTKNWNIGGEIGLSIAPVNIGIQGGVSGSKTKSFTSTTENQMRNLAKAVSSHVAKADSNRQIDINTETSTTSINEDEETIHRSIENYNKSRVLNFVFRQLLQEFISITSLVNVTFLYTNGYPESVRKFTIDGLEDELNDLLVDSTAVEEVANQIYTHLCNIKNYLGNRESIIEPIEEPLDNCINPGVGSITERYVRIRNIISSYSPLESELTFSVQGIITDVTTRVTRTASLVCDALLGQGEALDCYNQKLQDAAAINATLGNLENIQKIVSVEQITDPMQRAADYKKIFGTCCETPQTQVIS